MKKIKIMLLSFALLAIIGGALAFKAKFTRIMCYRTTTGAGPLPFCTAFTTMTTTEVVADAEALYYTTTPHDLGEGLTCYTWINGESGPTTTLTCVRTLVKAD